MAHLLRPASRVGASACTSTRWLGGSVSRITQAQQKFKKKPQRVVVEVPATSANLGPGFDAFGFAVDVWNTVEVERSDKFELILEGQGAEQLPATENNVVVASARKALEKLGQEMPPLRFVCKNAIPPTRGLGSSSAALVGGLAAGLAIGGQDLDSPHVRKLLLQMAADEEGHPDNVAPAVYGGFQVAINTERQWITQRVGIPEGLQMVMFIPTFELPTSEARGALPEALTYKDAVFNIGRASMLVHCFATGQFEPLRYAMEDALHQPYRAHMFPFKPLIEVALQTGAHGAYLSGAGPTVLAITGGQARASNVLPGYVKDTMSQFLAEEVSAAMMAKAKVLNLEGYVHIAEASQDGARCTVEYE